MTLCVQDRLPVLACPEAWTALSQAVSRLDRWQTLAMLAMPDHIHVLAAPLLRDESPGRYSYWLKRNTRAALQGAMVLAARRFRPPPAAWRFRAGEMGIHP